MFSILKSQKGLAPVIVVLIIIGIAAIGGGIYWWQKSTLKENVPAPTFTTPTAPTSPTPTPTPPPKDETSSWKTYRNAKYDFEIKYPREWQSPVEHLPPTTLLDIEFNKGVDGAQGFNITIFEKNGPASWSYTGIDEGIGLSLKSATRDLKQCLKPTTEVSIGIGNYPAKEVYTPPSDSCYQEVYFYFFQKGNYDYFITPRPRGVGYQGYDGKKLVKELLPEFYQIISTLKFIE